MHRSGVVVDIGITLRKRGRVWWADVHFPGHPRRQFSLKTVDRDEAIRKARDIPRLQPAGPKIEEVIRDYLADRQGAIATGTVTILKDAFGRFKTWALGQKVERIGSITPKLLSAYRVHMLEQEKYSPSTVNRDLKKLRTLARWSVKREIIAKDFTTTMEYCKVEQKKRRILSLEELHKLFDAIEDGDLRDVATFALQTGARVGDILSLTPSDVDLFKGSITFRGQKTGTPYEVPLNTVALEIARNRMLKPKLFEPYSDGSRDGAQRVYWNLRQAGKRAGLGAGVSMHALRRSWATILSDVIPTSLLERLGGWKGPRVPSAFYIGKTNTPPPVIAI